MSIEIGTYQILALLAICVGGAFALWNLWCFLRLRRVVFRPRVSGPGSHGDSRRVERALLQRTFVQFLLWSFGTFVFVIGVLPRLVQIWAAF